MINETRLWNDDHPRLTALARYDPARKEILKLRAARRGKKARKITCAACNTEQYSMRAHIDPCEECMIALWR